MLDHYNHPNNKMSVNDERYKMVHNASDSCIDDITVYMLAEDGVVDTDVIVPHLKGELEGLDLDEFDVVADPP